MSDKKPEDDKRDDKVADDKNEEAIEAEAVEDAPARDEPPTDVDAEVVEDSAAESAAKPTANSTDDGKPTWPKFAIAAALLIGLLLGPALHIFLTPYLPDRFKGEAGMSSAERDRVASIETKLAGLQDRHRVQGEALTKMQRALKNLENAEASRTTSLADGDAMVELEKRLQENLAETRQTVAELATQMGEFGEALANRASDAGAIDGEALKPLQQRLNDLETALLKLNGEVSGTLKQAQQLTSNAVAPLDNNLKQLQGQVSRLAAEAKQRVAAVKMETFAIALVQLRREVESGKSYREVLSAINDRFGGDTVVDGALSDLREHAERGVRTGRQLRDRFDGLVDRLLEEAEGKGGGIWESTKKRLSGLVKVRRTGNISGDDLEAVIARAEYQLDAGDLTAAVEELEKLPGDSRPSAQGWIDAAKAKLAVEQAMKKLEQRALAGSGAG